jgi:hypothetical protein
MSDDDNVVPLARPIIDLSTNDKIIEFEKMLDNIRGGDHFILDQSHTPHRCKFSEFIHWKMTNPNTQVAHDAIGDVHVSTVFLGLDHAFFGGPPLLFETMIFGGRHDRTQLRCSTWEKAERQHAKTVEMVRGAHLRVVK